MTFTHKVFEIPSWNIPRLEKEVAKINKRAAKLGVGSISLVTHEIKKDIHPEWIARVAEGLTIESYEEIPKVTLHCIEFVGEPPKLAGWSFVGKLDHISLPGEVVLKAVPGQEIPAQFYNAEAMCKHCGKIRRRNDTFILNHEDGQYTQVGRQCIRDFLGHDPSRIASHLTAIWKLIDNIENENEGWFGGGYRDYMFSHEKVLTVTSAVIRTFGWMPKSRAEGENKPATAQLVCELLLPAGIGNDSAKQQLVKQIKWNDVQDTAEANNATEWLKTQPDNVNNDYMQNLKKIARAESVPSAMFGYWCSLISAYHRAVGEEANRKQVHKLDAWLGNPKDKVTIEVQVVGKTYLSSNFGAVTLVRMVDTEGRTLVWFASSKSGMDERCKYLIKGTIKSHGLFREQKQTVLTRVKVIENKG